MEATKYVPANQKGLLVPVKSKKHTKLCQWTTIVVLTLAFVVALTSFLVTFYYSLPKEVQLREDVIEELREHIMIQELELQRLKGNETGHLQRIEEDSTQHCRLEKDPGPCLTSVPRWFYDFQLKKCSQFIYGGCAGNANNFVSVTECQVACQSDGTERDEILVQERILVGDDSDRCSLSPNAGPCRGSLPRIYFDPQDGQCKKFLYGGCAGNNNNFLSIEECVKACASHDDIDDYIVEEQEDICMMEPDAGNCRGVIQRWFFNSTIGECHKFNWGGCGGNRNNFSSLKKCQGTCSSLQQY